MVNAVHFGHSAMLVSSNFALQPRTFSLEVTKVGFVISLLQGEPQSWAQCLLEQRAASLTNLTNFFDSMA